MTVPLMRRRGIEMTRATAMANPLSLPVALAGTGTYIVLSTQSPLPLGEWHLGYIDIRAAAVLVVGSRIGIRAASLWIGRIPDRVHAKVYLGLLIADFLAMVTNEVGSQQEVLILGLQVAVMIGYAVYLTIVFEKHLQLEKAKAA